MIQLKELTNESYITLKCKLSYVAISIPLNENYQEQYKNHHYSETALAYLKHKKTAIENYIEAEKAVTPFLQNQVNNYDEKLVSSRLRDYILFCKISLDLLVCLVKVLVDRELPENESNYPDIHRRHINNKSINKIFDSLVKEAWFKELKITRDRLIHRGYHMRCSQKTTYPERIRNVQHSLAKENLTVIKSPRIDKKYFDGVNDFSGFAMQAIKEDRINLDIITEGFIKSLPLYEQELYSILELELDFKTKTADYEIGFSQQDLERVNVN